MKNKRVAIIGAGLNGLILAQLLKKKYSVTIYSKDTMGQNIYFSLGPRILHYSKKVKLFLKSIGIYENEKEFKIGYINCDDLSNKEIIKKYALKNDKDLNDKSIMSENKNKIIGWNIYETTLIYNLISRNVDNIIKYDIKHKMDIEFIKENYDIVYNTIPLNIITKLYGYNFEQKIKEATFILSTEKYKYKEDYVYDLGNNSIKRISNFKGNSIYELINQNKNFNNDLLNIVNKGEIIDIRSGKYSLLANERIEKFNNIIMVGRFAENDHNIKLNDVIERYYNEE